MFQKFLRIFNTVKYLKASQIFYQVWYRLKAPFIPYFSYNKYFGSQTKILLFHLPELFLSTHKSLGKNKFQFLNLDKDFGDSVDWNFQGHGKLWNYNLQYFEYLHDENISNELKQEWIEDFCEKLLAKKVKAEPYPVSLRIINWILYSSKSGYNSPLFNKTLKYQVRYLQCNLEYHILANHFLENLVTLCVASLWLQDKLLEAWSFPKLQVELNEQILQDGAHYECSPMYHSIITVRVLLLYHLLQKNNSKSIYIKPLREKLEGITGWLQAFSFRDNTFAHFGDSTNNIVPQNKVILKAAEKCFITPKQPILQNCGYRKLVNKNIEILVDVGNISPSYQPGHSHSDMLHFCMQVKGCPVLIDTGTSTYNNNVRRAYERSTVAHNTVSVNGNNQSDVWSAFRVGKRGRVTIHKEEGNKLEASIIGYNQYNISHFRTFELNENNLVIVDELKGNKVNLADAKFHFNHNLAKPSVVENTLYLDNGMKFEFDGGKEISIHEYQQALEFNVTRKAYVVNISFHSKLKTKIIVN